MMQPRTYLFVPGNRAERFDKAWVSAADAVVLDLEDAVAAQDKDGARENVERWLAQRSEQERPRVVVRINDASTPWFVADAAMLHRVGAALAMLPKADSAQTIADLRRAGGGQLKVLALIESAHGVQEITQVATAPGVVRLAFGTIDYALDMNLADDGVGLDYAYSRIAVASRACGLPAPVAGVTADIRNAARIRQDLERARCHGFGAKLCIHPDQVTVVHEALRPRPDDIAWAQRVADASNAAAGAAIQVDGRMVDRPVIEQALSILRRAAV